MFKINLARTARAVAAVLILTALPGCATFYVDDTLHDLAPAEKAVAANPQPVQLLFEFQTKGVQNGKATDLLKDKVLATVQASGLFSQVSATPASNGAILNVVLNNVPLTDNAFAKGFMTGFTFGLVGTNVGDGYICTIDYLPGGNGAKITAVMRDAIYTSLGATAGTPDHAQKVASLDQAIEMMSRQVVSNTLNDLAKKNEFNASAKVSSK